MKKKNDLLIKAALKTKEEVKELEHDGWESVEEDYPHIQIDDLKSIEQ
jgi:predicted RNA binding protein YcfA (HicA-like mRNA interferase family)